MSQRHGLFESPPRAFISYARTDGESVAAQLRDKLEREQPEITLWHDRARMEGGVGWWKQITEALDQVEFLIMVMTPAAMTSEIARKEWRYARQQGVRICPVMGVEGRELEFAALPGWMRKAHFYDLDKEWDIFVGFLKSARKDNRVPFMAPDLRGDFVERPRESEGLLESLIDEASQGPIATTIALQGSGGFGKTTLAAALCHNEDVITAFDDGILWATLGETPKVQHELTKLYAALTGDRPAFVDADDASIQLASRLDEKNCLIVIDDVWDSSHVKPFLRGGSQCARLITTRRIQVVTDVGAARVIVDEMTEEQSVQMLAARLRSPPTDLAPLRALSRRLGEWPLLLKLAGSQIRERVARGDSLEGALAYVNRALDKRGAVAFDRESTTERHDTVARTVTVSLDLLRAEDQQHCAELAIFRTDQLIPLSAAGALWGKDEFDAEELVQQLDGAALIDFDIRTGGFRIHDVLQAYLHSRLDDPRAIHLRLVNIGWHDFHSLPDRFAWSWIGWHLAQAGEHERLRELLLEFEWLYAKLKTTDVQAVLRDFDLLPPSEGLRAVRNAIRLASHGLSIDAGQLAAQLTGRLERQRSQVLDRLLDHASKSSARPWLTLTDTSLTHPGGALVGIYKAHSGPVEAVALSPDDKRAVSSSGDRTLRVWDVDGGRVVRVLDGHSAPVHCVVVSRNGRSVLSASEDRSIRMWDLETGRVERVLKGHYGAVYGVATSHDGQLAASISDDGTLRVWDLATGKQVNVFKGYPHQLHGIAIASDGRHAAFGAGDWTVAMIDLRTGDTVRIFEGHEGIVKAVALTPDGRKLLSGSEDGTLRLWDVATGEPLLVLVGHSAEVVSVAITSDGRRAVSGSRDKALRVWDLETAETLQTLEGHSGAVTAVATTSSGLQAISGAGDMTVRHWSLEGAPAYQPLTAHPQAVSLLAISADGNQVISGSRDSALHVWRARADRSRVPQEHGGEPTMGWTADALDGPKDRIRILRMTGDGKTAIAGLGDGTLWVWDLNSGVPVHVLVGSAHEVRKLELSVDGTRAVSISRDRTVRLWDLENGRAIRALVAADNDQGLSSFRLDSALAAEIKDQPIVDLAEKSISRDADVVISNDGRHAVLGSHSNLCIWDLEAGTAQHQDFGDFNAVAIATDDHFQRIVIGSRFGPMQVWNVADGKALHFFDGHTETILDIVISADGRQAVSASRDDTIRVWDLDTGRECGAYQGTAGKVDIVVVAPNGKFAYSVYGDTIVASSVNSFTRLGSISFDHQITAASVTPDGERLAIGDDSGRVHFLRLET